MARWFFRPRQRQREYRLHARQPKPSAPIVFFPSGASSGPHRIAGTRKRDDQTTAASNTTTNALCTTIAAFAFHNLPIYPTLGNRKTRPPLTLGPSSYVLSFTNDYRVLLIGVVALVDGHTTRMLHNIGNPLRGTVPFSLDQTAEVHFVFSWGLRQQPPGGGWLASGELALFRVGPG